MATTSISRALSGHAEADPDRPAVTFEERTVTRGQLEVRTNRLARAYEQLGVKHGDLVTIGLPNGIEFYEACCAAWKLGAVPQPVSWRLPDRERRDIVDLADPPIVVGVPEGSHAGRVCVPEGYEPDAALDDSPLPDRIAPSWKAPTSGGSTGRPKLIVSGDPGTVDTTAPIGFRVKPDGTQVVPGPLYHNAPFASSALGLIAGNHLVVERRFDPLLTLQLIERHRADFILLVPTMMLRIWRLPAAERDAFDLSSLEVVWHMAAPCPPWLKEAWIEWLGPERIFELYAGTEAQSATIITGTEWLEHRGSVGRPAYGEMQVRDPDGDAVAAGEVGEIWMRASHREEPSYRYVGAEARVGDDGWESLGDLGWMDADGYLYLSDRRTDLILCGGANVYPAEVEAALEEHPDVVTSAVVGLPDEDLGQRVHAIVQATRPVSDEELRAFLSERLVRYKVPRTFELTDEPLRDDSGKVRRSALREART